MAVITLETLAEQIELRYEAGGLSRDSLLDRPDIILLIRQASTRVVNQHLTAKYGVYDYEEDMHFINAYYGLTPDEDSNTGLYYIDLPTLPMALPENRGVKEVYPGKGLSNPYMPLPVGTTSFFKDALVGEVGYTIEKNKILFHNMCKKPTSITVKMVLIAPEELTGSEQFYLPYEMQELVIADVLKMLGMSNPEDPINDNVEPPKRM